MDISGRASIRRGRGVSGRIAGETREPKGSVSKGASL